jgi:hypothetical protein
MIETHLEIDAPDKHDDGLLTVTVKGKPEDVMSLLVHGLSREALLQMQAALTRALKQVETSD